MPVAAEAGSSAGLTVPIRIDTPDDQLSGLYCPAGDSPTGPAVLFCGPWGWNEVASYRVRRDWALRLCGAGYPNLRFDLPAVGDSTGDPSQQGLVARWVVAVDAAARRLDEIAGGRGITVLGLGIGGLLALSALGSDSPITQLALWGTPASGRRFVREQRAFSRMQPWESGDDDFDPEVPDGWLEAGGFLLSPGTLAELEALAPRPAPGSLARVIAFDRDGVLVDEKLLAGLTREEADVMRASGPGWGEMSAHPESGVTPEVVASALETWLAQSSPPGDRSSTRGAAADLGPRDIDAAPGIRERAFEVAQDWGRAFAVLAEPVEPSTDDLWAIFANAGAVRHIGPSRLWVEIGRASALAGVPALRLDLQGIGEADGEAGGELRGGDFNMARYAGQLRAMLDFAERRGARRFIMIGLCAGGHNSFRIADDPRIEEVVLVNASALRWDGGLPQAREARKAERLFDRRWLSKLLRGQIDGKRLLAVLRALGRRVLAKPSGLRLRSSSSASPLELAEADLGRLLAAGTRVLVAFSGDEPLARELRAAGIEKRFAGKPGYETRVLPGYDHTLRPPVAQRAVTELILEEILACRAAVSAEAARS